MNNKSIANQVLLLVFLLFLLSAWLRHCYKDILAVEMLFSVMEAALVGGIADWFAITALFKKPLGFPWHTALIPRHREKVIRSIRNIIDQDLLTIQSIKKRVESTCFVTLLIGFVDNERGREFIRKSLERFCRDMINKLDIRDLVNHMDSFIRKEIKNIDLISQMDNVVRWLLENDRTRVLTMYIVEELIIQLDKNEAKGNIYQYLEEMTQAKNRSPLERAVIWLGEQTNSVSLSDATDAFYAEILAILQEIKNPDHIIHNKIHEFLTAIAEASEKNYTWLEQVENWKMALATDLELGDAVIPITEYFLKTTNPQFSSQLMDWIYIQLDHYWMFFKGNIELQEWLEVRIKQMIDELIEKEHYIIGEIVQSVLGEFNNDKLNRFVEDKAGNDLQWIRINGSIVGGIVGLLMFFFLHYVYDPYVVPIIQSWF
ncbi:DUF445 domain-containing protein [Pelosinus propionicus]|uniref:Uncharacterized membrane-anchored protein YjiN, DUF445 family n=1 Tax=Pelosinus propionicus DSM 13327 TaxID=1123291 RepID=A0A1I4I7E8_9FIRM|nr:DUF445 domain-containing protein [Pelosinus propionicus]SFL50312.1 Uncharacterized membrane-anchored protein YjiN, DUF445 family [Pelosinus propionicus DSM 13327]